MCKQKLRSGLESLLGKGASESRVSGEGTNLDFWASPFGRNLRFELDLVCLVDLCLVLELVVGIGLAGSVFDGFC
jgi:hypothetical protein